MANEGLRSATVAFVVLYFVASVFFAAAGLYDGYSNTTFGVGLFFWLYVGIAGGLWIILAIIYLIYSYCAFSDESATDYDYSRGVATLTYPKYLWESNEFFFGTFILFIMTLGPWAAVYANLGYSYDPQYATAPLNDLNNLQLYSVNFLASFNSIISALLCINFVWILAKPNPYELSTLDNIDGALAKPEPVAVGVTNTKLQQEARTSNYLYIGAAPMHRKRK